MTLYKCYLWSSIGKKYWICSLVTYTQDVNASFSNGCSQTSLDFCWQQTVYLFSYEKHCVLYFTLVTQKIDFKLIEIHDILLHRGSKIIEHCKKPYSQLMSHWNQSFGLGCDWLISWDSIYLLFLFLTLQIVP